ncbi:hypothetical protein L798_10792 [Zootermopsis nevadensis]|uniref:Uncharacterized protein n=1 Tax=Zootermopsis nevadensis TaxID=136037 RepID=A0A067RN72_ZOONE|nr:hypothetical protein L798_10792 [Zootermopsis nevadensis]
MRGRRFASPGEDLVAPRQRVTPQGKVQGVGKRDCGNEHCDILPEARR